MDEEPFDVEEEVSTIVNSPRMEPLSALSCVIPAAGAPPRNYWVAYNFASRLHNDFIRHREDANQKGMVQCFYLLARYYGRTLGILRDALRRGNEELVNATLRNLVILHQPLYLMRDVAPTDIPLVLTLNKNTSEHFFRDILMEALSDADSSITLEALIEHAQEMHLIHRMEKQIVLTHIENLVSRGHVRQTGERYRIESIPYNYLNMDHANLEALLGTRIYREFEENGFLGLSDIVNRKNAFRTFFQRFSGCSPDMADLFIAAATEITRPIQLGRSQLWQYADIIGSPHPRPYQRDAYAIFKGYGYQGALIEAPTGSGKTLMGLMCIQDWLRTLSRGESILILVPTSNYVQQWVAETCYKDIGLKMPIDELFTGTPSTYEAERRRSGAAPPILIMTYTSLAQLGSPTGKGGFDKVSVEKFLQASNVQYVILDEVHKVADNMKSVSADVARLLTEWLHDGSLRGLIGFSGTAETYRDRFPLLGLQLVYVMPPADLIAYGFVAPFAELGVPFSYSDREKRVLDLLDLYKEQIRAFINLIGVQYLIDSFKSLPMDQRVLLGKHLDMYEAQRDQEGALRKRFRDWEQLKEISLNELNLVVITQTLKKMSDAELVEDAVRDSEARDMFKDIVSSLNTVRDELKDLVYFQDLSLRLDSDGYGYTFQPVELRQPVTRKAKQNLKDALASTILGLYNSLRNFYFRIGEGRLDTINSIIEAEYRTRPVSGVIVFDNAKRIKWEEAVAAPGYTGVAGVFSQMLGDPTLTPLAALSSEVYMPWSDENPLPAQISGFIKEEIMVKELGDSFFGLVTSRIAIPPEQLNDLRSFFNDTLSEYVTRLHGVGSKRPGEFTKRVLAKFETRVSKLNLGRSGQLLKARLSLHNNVLRRWVDNFYDYAIISRYFDEAHEAKLRQASGRVRQFYVVKMPGGEKKLLMYNLMSKVFDAPSLPVNVIIVSSWARTGWNVIKPNILIDATATRDVTAWQQLRGRAMRARRTWDKRAYELITLLLGTQIKGIRGSAYDLPADVLADAQDVNDVQYVEILLEPERQLLRDSYHNGRSEGVDPVQVDKINEGRLSDFTQDERENLAVDLMLYRNKVTHIFELVKAYGSTKQVTYNRATRTWIRTESIALKHMHEYSVNPFTGVYSSGEVHAPLLYAQDPRENSPSSLIGLLNERMTNRDPVIVKGWIRAVVTDFADSKTSETGAV
ncbi:DEAD/DEAH box helicase family protein [Candidatus Bathyarchaeota archaeon]|nr:DEAD/DEAH box helicase family protein [Candidatus Bathyarchaeota archaeon]